MTDDSGAAALYELGGLAYEAGGKLPATRFFAQAADLGDDQAMDRLGDVYASQETTGEAKRVRLSSTESVSRTAG